MRKQKVLSNKELDFNHLSEQEIWDAISMGSQKALSFLYKLYVRDLFKYGFFLVPDKDIVEDAIHDLYVRIWTKRKTQIKIHSIKSYLFISLRREVLRRKNEFARISHRLDNLEENLLFLPSIEESLISKEASALLVKKIRAFINNLTDRQKEIIHLRFYQDLTYKEISALLEIDQNYAYNLISKAIAQIRKQF